MTPSTVFVSDIQKTNAPSSYGQSVTIRQPSETPVAAAAVGLPDGESTIAAQPSLKIHNGQRGTLQRTLSPGFLPSKSSEERGMHLELEDGTIYRGYSFGAEKSIAGELVFQTGMVGYPESITDPSYRGQILVITFPLVGNYGVPSRDTMDDVLHDLPAYFESSQIHIAGLVVASYCGEDFSHFLAESSLSAWLKEQSVPAMHGVDTRALTKRIREDGSMLGRMLIETLGSNGIVEGYNLVNGCSTSTLSENWKNNYEDVNWFNPNETNLVAQGEKDEFSILYYRALISSSSLDPRATSLHHK